MNLAEDETENAADEMVEQVLKAVQEIKSSNRFLLKRLNQFESPNHCTCSQLLKRSHDEIQNLLSKVVELARVLREKDEAYRELGTQFETLKGKIDSLETSAMALQADDSKLRSVSIRKDHSQYPNDVPKQTFAVDIGSKNGDQSAVKREPDFVKSEECSPTVMANLVDYTNPTLPETQNSTTKASKQTKITPKAVENFNIENTRKDTRSRQQAVEVISDTERKSYGDEHFWRYLAQRELDDGRKTLLYLGGIHSVICLDISESMAEGDAWTQATTFLEDYLIGLENISRKYGHTDEHVAFVTFGHITQVQKRFTNKYDEIRELIGKQKLGGPSPLYGGLILGLAAAGASGHVIHLVNNVQVFTKIIIVTDGRPTEVGQYAGPDIPTDDTETKPKIIRCLEEDFKINHINTFCVPVGNADTNFIEMMMAVADGRIISYKSGNQLSRRGYLATKIRDPLGLESFSLFSGGASFLGEDESNLSADDKQIVEEIKSDTRKHFMSGMSGVGRVVPDKYREIPGKSLAPIGSRVRRGPDWMWNSQDSHGPGTIIGHDDGDQVWVEWDINANQNIYRYGSNGYDVLIVEEPRELKPGQKIAVGCIVKQVTKGQNCQKGTVIKLDEMNKKATVRWLNGRRGEYSYPGTGKNEIEVCGGFHAFSSHGHVLGYSDPTLLSEKKTSKNKNKNVH